jgi:hypothetical protein
MGLAERAGDRLALGEQPAEDARVPVDLQVVGHQVGPEREDDREADQVYQ